MNEALIYGGVRSPRARAKADGGLHAVTPHELLSQLYRALQERTDLDPKNIDEAILGCVTQYGEQAGNIAKASTLYAGWPFEIAGLTVNRYCSSGLDAIALAAMKINVGAASQLMAGGIEMMSRVPMMTDEARVFKDPDFAMQCRVLLMGSGADLIASRAGVSRKDADTVAFNSQQRSAHARAEGYFAKSIVPIQTPSGLAQEDECIRPATTMEDLAAMEPVFAKIGAAGADAFQLAHSPGLDAIEHIHTAGNSPAMADAACVLLLGDRDSAATLAVAPRARIASSITVADDPFEVLTGCVKAVRELLDKTGLSVDDIDLFEIHEAFAAVSVVAEREFGIDGARHNVNGGVIALGHPMGSTGAILTLTLLDELERRGLRRGIVSTAGAAGSGSALLIDRDLSA